MVVAERSFSPGVSVEVEHLVEAAGIDALLEGVGEAFAVGPLVVDDGDALCPSGSSRTWLAATSACWSSRPQVRSALGRLQVVSAGVVAVGVTIRTPFSARRRNRHPRRPRSPRPTTKRTFSPTRRLAAGDALLGVRRRRRRASALPSGRGCRHFLLMVSAAAGAVAHLVAIGGDRSRSAARTRPITISARAAIAEPSRRQHSAAPTGKLQRAHLNLSSTGTQIRDALLKAMRAVGSLAAANRQRL